MLDVTSKNDILEIKVELFSTVNNQLENQDYPADSVPPFVPDAQTPTLITRLSSIS